MLTEGQLKAVQNIDYMIASIKGQKRRFCIDLSCNQLTHTIRVVIKTEDDNTLMYERSIQADQTTYIEIINKLRDTFILYGALVSKLTKHPNQELNMYYKQQLYLENLEMSIQINSKKEELEAARAHKKVLCPDFPPSLLDGFQKTKNYPF